MEGAEKKEISLVSGIDIGSSDSFVSLEQPLFTHNRQKYQGGTLPSSVRFEHDGFACGWDVYQFTLTEDHIPLSPADIYATRKRMFSSGVYRFKFYNTSDVEKGTLYFIRKTIVKDYKVITNVTTEQNTNGFVLTGNYTDILNQNHDIQITGTWSEDFTTLSWQVLVDSSTASGITITHDHDGYISDITVQDTDNTLNLNITDLCLTSDVFSGDDIIATFQQYANNMYTWLGNMVDITYNGSIEATPHNDDISNISFSDDLSFDEVDHNILSATMSLKYSLDYVLSASADDYIPYIKNFVIYTEDNLISSDAYTGKFKQYVEAGDYSNFNIISGSVSYDNYLNSLYYVNNDSGSIKVSMNIPTWVSSYLIPYTRDYVNSRSGVQQTDKNCYIRPDANKMPPILKTHKPLLSGYPNSALSIDISSIADIYDLPCRCMLYPDMFIGKKRINPILKAIDTSGEYTYTLTCGTGDPQSIYVLSDIELQDSQALFCYLTTAYIKLEVYVYNKSTGSQIATKNPVIAINLSNIYMTNRAYGGSDGELYLALKGLFLNYEYEDDIYSYYIRDFELYEGSNISLNYFFTSGLKRFPFYEKYNNSQVAFSQDVIVTHYINDSDPAALYMSTFIYTLTFPAFSDTRSGIKINSTHYFLVNLDGSWIHGAELPDALGMYSCSPNKITVTTNTADSNCAKAEIALITRAQEVTITPKREITSQSTKDDFTIVNDDYNYYKFDISGITFDTDNNVYSIILAITDTDNGLFYYKPDYSNMSSSSSYTDITQSLALADFTPQFLYHTDSNYEGNGALTYVPFVSNNDYNIKVTIKGDAYKIEPINSLSLSTDYTNNYDNHDFFRSQLFKDLQTYEVSTSTPVYTYDINGFTGSQVIVIDSTAFELTLTYNMTNSFSNISSVDDILTLTVRLKINNSNYTPVFTIDTSLLSAEILQSLSSITELFTYLTLQAVISLSYNLKMPLLYTKDNSYTIESYSDNKIYFKVGAYTILLNLSTGTVSCEKINYSTTLEDILRTTEYHDSTHYDVISDINVSLLLTMLINMYIRGVYSTENVLLTSATSLSDDGQLVITFDDTDYTLSIVDMFSDEFNNYINEYVIDTRDSSLSSKLIEKIDTNDAYTFIRQAWNTSTEVRSYWVIDPLTYISLDDYNFYVYKKAEGLDPWYGDKWKLTYTIPKTDIINSETVWYGATSCYNVEHAYFLTVTYIDDNTFRVTVYNGNDMSLLYYSSIDINYVKLGTKLNRSNKVINTYSSISVRMLLSKSYISATAIDDKIIMGLHYDCNFNQWALIFDIGQQSLDKIIQGYGYVGYNGDLTGGEIPNDFFDVSYGFDDIVYDYNTKLNTTPEDIDNINDLNASMSYVVGTESRQWYIKNSIKYIVSHLAYKDEEYTPVLLPLSNNYTAGYASPSFSTIVFSDTLLNAKSMKSLFPLKGNYASAWKAALITFGYPLIYYVAPKLTSMVYLQQTVGQSAYVHYNSASERHKNTADNSVNYAEDKSVANIMHDYMQNGDAITFDTKYIKQSLSCDDTSYNDMFALLSTLGISALDYVVNNTHVTEGDKFKMSFGHGDSYSAYAAKNFESEALTDLRMESTTPSEVSEVTVSKSLDMFYSTSDTQNVCAGPGYVNHNFVAQCINQSTTSLQLQMTQQQLMFILTALTRYQLEIEYLAAKKAADFCKRTADNFSGPAGGGMGVVYFNTAVAVGASIGWLVAVAYEHTLKIAVDNVPDLIRAMGGDSLKSTVTARMTKHKYDIEPKHRYGSKQEMFMYPSRAKGVSIIDESVSASYVNKTWEINKPTSKNLIANSFNMVYHNAKFVTDNSTKGGVAKTFDGDVPYYIYKIKGNKSEKTLPSGIAYIAGVQSFLPTDPYKNDTVSESAPVFSTPIIYDYLISEQWDIFATASGDNGIAWVSCKGTKLIDGAPTNIFISDESAIIASPYTVIEILDGCDKDYLRPTLVTPSALALNISKYNVLYEKKAYNAFDGTSSRILNWAGAPAMAVNKRTWLYSFIANDRFKRSNKLPALEVLGNFKVLPTIDNITADKDDRFILHMIHPEDTGFKLDPNIIGEDLDTRRYSIPIFSEVLSTLPSQVKTIESYVLAVYDGITSLCSDIRNTQSRYKVPMSVDFNINGQMFRFTNEYICSVITSNGAVVLQQLVPTEGLTFLGATPYNAYLYSQSNRLYYIYSGGTTLQAVDMIERFRNVKLGMYDFIEQSVAMECLTDMSRIDSTIDDDSDETDNVFIANLKNGGFDSEVSPPATTLFDEDSWFKVYSLPSGIVFQGPNRCHIHRQIFSKYMTEQVKNNLGKWGRVPREYFHPFRDYGYKYTAVNEPVSESDNKNKAVAGWTHNPFVLVTAMLGADLSVDCNFEWEIIFTWTDEMDAIYTNGQYACVNVMAETITEGGKVTCRPSHIFLTKELFSRNGDQGYYTFRYVSNNGIGNRERLFLWSDAYIAINSLSVEFKPMSQRRASVLTQQIDTQNMKEL